MKYEYAGGVLDHERDQIERFERDVVPFLEKKGGWIGEMAMAGDLDAEHVIRAYRAFVEGLPELRGQNFEWLVRSLKRVESKLH